MAKEPRSLAGKVVAITGGARGIGEVTARSLVREGAKVAIGDLDLELAEKTASAIGGDTIALELDVTRRESFASYLSQVEERLGPIDVLINNAGIMPLGRFVDEDDATARRMFDINVHGADVRHEARAALDDAPQLRPHREHRLAGGQGRLPRRRHLLRAPSTPWSASPRPSAASSSTRTSRSRA